MEEIRVIHPSSNKELQAYYDLRYELLRKPWGQPNEIPDDEDESIHYLAINENGTPLGVGRLSREEKDTGRIRFMATVPSARGMGVGKRILDRMEWEARDMGYRSIVLDARENAVPFYERGGYEKIRPSHVLWGRIQHYSMKKKL